MEHQTVSLPRVMVAAPASSSGKTSLTCALLQAALNRGVDPCAFKCGPDYIDPLFHREVLSLPSRNLDLFFSDEPTVRGLMARAGAGHGLAVLEGCMGFYDGIAGTERASSWHLARATDTPVVLTVVPGGTSPHIGCCFAGAAVIPGARHDTGRHPESVLPEALPPSHTHFGEGDRPAGFGAYPADAGLCAGQPPPGASSRRPR